MSRPSLLATCTGPEYTSTWPTDRSTTDKCRGRFQSGSVLFVGSYVWLALTAIATSGAILRTLCEKDIFPKFRHSKGLIDYFLANIVFAKEMKEFPHKLSVSGWDIGKAKAHQTTGFSGTNDFRTVLPLSVHQMDLEKQVHANAFVLDYLLQNKNTIELMPAQWAPRYKPDNRYIGAHDALVPDFRPERFTNRINDEVLKALIALNELDAVHSSSTERLTRGKTY